MLNCTARTLSCCNDGKFLLFNVKSSTKKTIKETFLLLLKGIIMYGK